MYFTYILIFPQYFAFNEYLRSDTSKYLEWLSNKLFKDYPRSIGLATKWLRILWIPIVIVALQHVFELQNIES